MGDVYWSVHGPLVARISKKLNIKYAIETGTYFGVGSIQLSCLFDKVWTIESNNDLFEFAKKNFKHIKNIEFLLGNSPDVLKSILPDINGDLLFFLDAHWFPTKNLNSSEDLTQCPVLEEIEAIGRDLISKHNSVVLIDDAAMFLKSLPPSFRAQEFPSLIEVIAKLKECLNVEIVEIMDDVIIAGPERLSSILREYEIEKTLAGAPHINS